MRLKLAMLTSAVLFVSASTGLAQGIDEEAKAAFKEGKALFEEGDFPGAAAAFRKANQLKPNWKIQYNIAQSEASAKRHGLALQAFEIYLAEGGDDLSIGRRDECVAEVKRLRAMVGEVEVEAPDGAVIYVDGVERDRAPLPGPVMVAAGVKHQVTVELDGELILDRPVRVSSGGNVSVKAEVAGADTGPAEEEPAPAELETGEGDPLKTWGWIAVGVGAALLVGGGVTGGMVLSLDGELEDSCVDELCADDDKDKIDKIDALALTTDILLPLGGAVAVTGAVLLIVAHTREKEEESEVSFAPMVGPGLVGAGVGGRF